MLFINKLSIINKFNIFFKINTFHKNEFINFLINSNINLFFSLNILLKLN